MWTIILVVIATPSGSYWLIRGIESDKIVDRGAGLVGQPGITCTPGYRTTPVCINHVTIFVDATEQLIKQTDVRGLYARAESSPGKTFKVQNIYIDTTNNQVNKLKYGGITYRLEPSQGSFLTLGIVVLIIDVGIMGFLVYLVRLRRGRAVPSAGGVGVETARS